MIDLPNTWMEINLYNQTLHNIILDNVESHNIKYTRYYSTVLPLVCCEKITWNSDINK